MAKKGGGDGQITGFKYYFDILMGMGRGPVDSVAAIRVGDLPLILNDQRVNGQVAINQADLFGGDEAEGGLVGTLTYMFGAPGQIVPAAVKNSIAGIGSGTQYTYTGGIGTSSQGGTVENLDDISDFRGVTTLFYTGQVCSNNPYPKTWKIRQRRAVQGWDIHGCWYPEKAAIVYADADTGRMWDANDNVPQLFSGVGTDGDTLTVGIAGNTIIDGFGSWLVGQKIAFNGDTGKWQKLLTGEGSVVAMNPVHILYQCCTDKIWGRGMERAELDNDSWVYAANYCFAEGLGLSMRWSKEEDLNEFVQKVINHVGAALYIDRGTGRLILRLIRNDYDSTQVPYFDYRSGLISVDTQETGSSLVVANEIVVNWVDPILDENRQTRVHNLASIQSIGAVRSETRDYPGICNAYVAQRVALRELNIGAAGLKRFKLKFDRRAWKMQPGNVLRISAPDKGIASAVLRVVTYDDGTAVDGTITMDCLQDVFGLPATIYSTPVQTTWVNPSLANGSPLSREAVQEASYFEMARGLTQTQRDQIDTTEGAMYGVAGKPTPTSQALVVNATPTGGLTTQTSGVFAPTGVTLTALDYYTTSVSLASGTDLADVSAPSTALIGAEVVRVTGFDIATGAITLERGGADTIPAKHAAGSTIFFHDVTKAGPTFPYNVGEVVDIQLQAKTNTSISSLSLASHHSVTVDARWNRPFVMGNIRLNGAAAMNDTPWDLNTDAVFTWAARNRLTQFDQFIGHVDGAVTAEAGTTYTVDVRNRTTNALIRSHTGLSASTYTYDDTEAAGTDPATLAFEFYSVRDALASYSKYRILVNFAGSDTGHGTATGVGAATGVGDPLTGIIGTATGVGAATGIGSTLGGAIGVGSADGVGEALGRALSVGILVSVGSADGTSDANAIPVTTTTGTGSAVGTGTAYAPTTSGYGETYGNNYGGVV